MRTSIITRETDSPSVSPLREDPRYQQAEARVEALRQRLAALEAERQRPAHVNHAEWVNALLDNPAAVLQAPPPPKNVVDEIAAVRQAIELAEQDLYRVAGEAGRELAERLRPGQVARGRQLLEALEHALRLIDEDFAERGTVMRAGYDAGHLLSVAAWPERDNLSRLIERLRGVLR